MFRRDAIHCHRSGGQKRRIGAEIGSYQVHQKIAVTSRESINTSHPLLSSARVSRDRWCAPGFV